MTLQKSLQLALLILAFIGGIYVQTSKHKEIQAVEPELQEQEYVVVDEETTRKIKAYLKSKNSPLETYAGIFNFVGSKYDIDPMLLTAISGVESSFGKYMPVGSKNPFGIGGSNLVYYDSYIQAIDSLGKTLRKPYYRKWHETGELSDLAAVYCERSQHWQDTVNYFLEEMK